MNAPKIIAANVSVRMQTFRGLIFACLLIAAASAQIARPSADSTRDANDGVYVRDSAVAAEKLALADRLEHLQEWAKAGDVYQELLQKFADRVAPLGKDKNDRINQYTSVANIVQDKISHWPADGLTLYRGRYETDAANLLQQAGNDPGGLHNVVSLYFLTDSGKTAAMRLIDIDMEDGDFTAAAWMGDRLLNSYPGIDAERPMLLYRTAMAYRLAGDAADAQLHADELSSKFATAQGAIEGKQIALADSLQKLLKSPQQTGENLSPDSWPMAFGSPDRARVPNVSGFGGAKIFNIELSKEDLKQLEHNVANAPPQRQVAERQAITDREQGLMTGVMPVVDRGELFFQDNTRVYALNLDSGLPLAGWAQTYDGDQNGRFKLTAWPTPRNMLQTIALTDDSVLALMGQLDMTAMIYGMNISERDTQLVCLDRRTGKQKWDFRPQQLASASLPELVLSGTPLVVGDNVYVTGHSIGGVQFQDCYLLCLDLAGHFKWATYIASANAGIAIFDGDSNDLNSAVAQLAYSGGRVFVLSNLGALAAVDAYDGTVSWLDLYPRDSNSDPLRQFPRGWNRPQTEASTQRPWTISPIIISNGKIYALPTDGRNLMIYDAATGAEVQNIMASHIQDATTLLAVLNDRLILCGPGASGQDEQTHVLCIDWRKYQANDLTGKEVVWRDTYPVGLRGRGFVTADAVYIPTQKKIFRIDMKTGKSDAQYPDGERTWDTSESSGNIVVTQDHLIIAGPQWVNVYTDLNLAMAKLDKEVAAARDDPNARLKYAEIMFVAGKTDVAVSKLDEAIQVIGGLPAAGASPARDRIFTDSLTFAEKMQPHGEDTSNTTVDAATINGLYDRAASAADDPQQQVNYRISRASFANHQHDAVTELRLLQEILAEPTWRSVAVVRENAGSPMQASNIAEAQIDELKKTSPDVYAPVEAEAAKAFSDAQTTADPAKLLAVAQVYPNSDVAPQAMLKAADAYESVGNPRQAVQILRQHYLKYPNASDSTIVLESLARNYLATPNHVDVALARLMQAAKRSAGAKLTRPMLLPDGSMLKDVSFEQAADSLRRYIEQDTARALPDLGIPPPPAPGAQATKAFIRQPDPVAVHIDTIVPPVKEFSRNDRIVTWSGDGSVAVFTPGKNDALFTSHLFKDGPINCAWMGDNLLLVSPSKIALLKPDGSSALWETELKAIPLVEVATRQDNPDDNADQQQIVNGPAQINVNGGRVVILQGGRRIFLPGQGRFRMRFGGGPIAVANQQQAPVAAGAEQFVKLTLLADRALLSTSNGRIICTDLADGKTLWQVRPSDRPAKTLLATDDFIVAEIADGNDYRVLAFDAFSGQPVTHREFANDNGGLINLALSTDGKLIYLLPDQLECYDLFEPADRAAFTVPVKGNDANGAFSGAVESDQLLITEGRIVVLSDGGRFVRIYSLETGKPMYGEGGQVADASHGLQTRANDWQVSLAAVGSRLYVIGAKSAVGYNLDDFTNNWSDLDYTDVTRFGYVIGKDYLLVIGQLLGDGNRRAIPRPASKAFVIRANSRMVLPNGHESGLFAYDFPLNSPTGITSYQGVDGGLFYLSGDHKLYFLKGTRQ